MKVISKPEALWAHMHARLKAKRWNYEALDRATGTKTGFNNVVGGSTKDMRLSTILRLLAVLDLEMVIRPKSKGPGRPRKYNPTDALPTSAAPQEEVPKA